MNAQRIVEQRLLLNAAVEIHARRLFEGHTRLVAFLQLQARQTHVEIGILCQSILSSGRFSQP